MLSLATGAGKTFIAVHLLKRIADAGLLRRALFICDRDELRARGLTAFQNFFGSNAAEVGGGNPQKNARVLITAQNLHTFTNYKGFSPEAGSISNPMVYGADYGSPPQLKTIIAGVKLGL